MVSENFVAELFAHGLGVSLDLCPEAGTKKPNLQLAASLVSKLKIMDVPSFARSRLMESCMTIPLSFDPSRRGALMGATNLQETSSTAKSRAKNLYVLVLNIIPQNMLQRLEYILSNSASDI
jgi:hypothetical protein